jgi:palmitoyl-protein thioesterase
MKVILFLALSAIAFSMHPVAVFHGINDSCDSWMGNLTKFISDQLNGVYTRCIESSPGLYSVFTPIKRQAEIACEIIKQDPNFQSEFNILAVSQGSLIGRYIIEACAIKGTVKRYIAIGGPQMGVSKAPHCLGERMYCNIVNGTIDFFVYNYLVQHLIGPAGYFRIPTSYDAYINYSDFLADLNNEKVEKNQNYKDRILQLEKVLLVKFNLDTMVIPKESAWFGYYDSEYNVVDLKDTEFYIKDYLGIRELVERGSVGFIEFPGEHVKFNNKDVVYHMIPLLK